MSSKDFLRGMEAGAKPFQEYNENLGKRMSDSAERGERTADRLERFGEEVIEYLEAEKKRQLYKQHTLADIKDLDKPEKQLLMSLLFTLADMEGELNEYQQTFLRSVKRYLEIVDVEYPIDPSVVENIDSKNDTKAILQAAMEFMYLGYGNHDYLDDYEEVFECFNINEKGFREIRKCINEIRRFTGMQGIAENYGFVDVMKESEENTEDNRKPKKPHYYDGSDISKDCADTVGMNDLVELDQYLVYVREKDWSEEGSKYRCYKVKKSDGEQTEIKLEEVAIAKHKPYLIGQGKFLYISSTVKVGYICQYNIDTDEISYIDMKVPSDTPYGNSIQTDGKYLIFHTDTDKVNCYSFDDKSLKTIVMKGRTGRSGHYLVNGVLYWTTTSEVWSQSISTGETRLIAQNQDFLAMQIFLRNDGYGITKYYDGILYSIPPRASSGEAKIFYVDTENPISLQSFSFSNIYRQCALYTGYGKVYCVSVDSDKLLYRYDFKTHKETNLKKGLGLVTYYEEGLFKKKVYVAERAKIISEWIYVDTWGGNSTSLQYE